MSFDQVVTALAALDPRPRMTRWGSLSYCVLDAVWSMGSRYREVVVPLVRKVAEANGDHDPLIDSTKPLSPDPLPLPTLRERYPTAEALQVLTNNQRTSTRSGITKADAVLRYAEILVENGVRSHRDVGDLMTDETRWERVDAALATVPGDGQHGVRRGYLWMLSGCDDLIKPDRMVLRWLVRHGTSINATAARDLLARAANELTERLGRPITPWMVDRAIWKAETAQAASRSIVVEVEGLPPIKNEALSLLAAAHPQRERVHRLLSAVFETVRQTGWTTVDEDVVLEVVVRAPTPRTAGDATNFLGGIADVLQSRKTNLGVDLSHLGELASCALFVDDSQIQRITYRAIRKRTASYTLRVTVR